jgi:hypothetical protein
MHEGVCLGTQKERDRLADLGVDGRIICEWLLQKLFGWLWFESIWFKIRKNGGRWFPR